MERQIEKEQKIIVISDLPETKGYPLSSKTNAVFEAMTQNALITSGSPALIGESAATIHRDTVNRVRQALMGDSMEDIIQHLGILDFYELMILRDMIKTAVRAGMDPEVRDDLDYLHKHTLLKLARYQRIDIEAEGEQRDPLKGLLLVHRGLLNTADTAEILGRAANEAEVAGSKEKNPLLWSKAGHLRTREVGAYAIQGVIKKLDRDVIVGGVRRRLEISAEDYGKAGDLKTQEELMYLASHAPKVVDYLEKFYHELNRIFTGFDSSTRDVLYSHLYAFLIRDESNMGSRYHQGVAEHCESRQRLPECGKHRYYQGVALIREGVRDGMETQEIVARAFPCFERALADFSRSEDREALSIVEDCRTLLRNLSRVVKVMQVVG